MKVKTFEVNEDTHLEITPEAREALTEIGLQPGREQDAYYKGLADAVGDALAKQATLDAIEAAMSRTDSDNNGSGTVPGGVTLSAVSSKYDRPLD